MEIGEIKGVIEYNREQEKKYYESGSHNPAFFMWFNLNGSLRRYGYVGKTSRGAIWDTTKKKVKERLRELIVDNLN